MMTSSAVHKKSGHLPLLMTFASPLEAQSARRLRYDRERQIAEVFLEGRWVEASEVRDVESGSTRMTKVATETTDDE